MDIQNHFYGHSAILATYCHQPRVRHIAGLLQHGWTAVSPLAVNFGDFPQVGVGGDSRRLFVWSHQSRAWDPTAEERSSTPVGAPFLYQLRLLQERAVEPRDDEHDPRPLIVPMHGTHVHRIVIDQDKLAGHYREAYGPATVCLHVEDLADPLTVSAWRRAGHDVVWAGERRDPLFLARQALGIQRASKVITNRLATVVFYAWAAGVPAEITGPLTFLEGESVSSVDRLQELWPELHEEGVSPRVAQKLAEAELGAAYLQDPLVLTELLGWQRRRTLRPWAYYWMGGPLRKAGTVLGLAERAQARTDAPPVGAAKGPGAASFLRHPASHLPGKLPRLPEPATALDWLRPPL